MSPIFEALGQPAPGAEVGVSAAYWAGVQTPSPAATEGLTVIPSGRATIVFFTWEGAWMPGFQRPLSVTPFKRLVWLTSRSKLSPADVVVRSVKGWTAATVWKLLAS